MAQIKSLEPPKLDLDQYIANYRGRTRFHRLYHIGKTSSYLAPEALKQAVKSFACRADRCGPIPRSYNPVPGRGRRKPVSQSQGMQELVDVVSGRIYEKAKGGPIFLAEAYRA